VKIKKEKNGIVSHTVENTPLHRIQKISFVLCVMKNKDRGISQNLEQKG
jgi:hypothetical protein